MSGTNRRLAGVIQLAIDGAAFDVVGDWEFSNVAVTRETLKGQSRVEGFSEMPNQVYMSGRLRDRADLPVAYLNGLTNATIVAVLASGKTVIMSNAWMVGEVGVNTQDAVYTVRFESDTMTESPA